MLSSLVETISSDESLLGEDLRRLVGSHKLLASSEQNLTMMSFEEKLIRDLLPRTGEPDP